MLSLAPRIAPGRLVLPSRKALCNDSVIASRAITFNQTQSSLDEAIFFGGLTDGLDWTDVQQSGGLAWGTMTGAQGPYADSTAIFRGKWGLNHSVRIIASKSGTQQTVQEIECRLRSTLVAHLNTGYETLVGADGVYYELVRWDGTAGAFTVIAQSGPSITLNDNSAIDAWIDDSIIHFQVDGLELFNSANMNLAGCLVGSATGQPGLNGGIDVRAWALANGGAYWSTGNPGLGMFSNSVDDQTYGVKSVLAASRP